MWKPVHISGVATVGPVQVQIQGKICTLTGEQKHTGLQTATGHVWTQPNMLHPKYIVLDQAVPFTHVAFSWLKIE